MGEPANRGRGSSSGGMMMHGANLKRRFFVSLVLTIPVLLLSSPMGLALPITLSFPGSAAGRFCAARRTSCAVVRPP